MRIRIPRRVVAAVDAFRDWGYTPLVCHRYGTLRRCDPLIAAAFLLCVGYYWWTGGWLGAMTGACAFMLVTMAMLWL